MRQTIKLLLVILTSIVSINCIAASPNEINLTVTADGTTKDEAIKNALRMAVEQTYGVFVSSNAEILNDELVRDEIATVSSGNIRKYNELVYSKNENSHTVTLSVIVSKGKLIHYAKSKGAECDLDGAALASDIELQLLYKKNEEAAVRNLVNEFILQLDQCFDYKVYVDKFSYTSQEERWDYIDTSYDLIYPQTRYADTSVSIPYKITATLNKVGVSMISQFLEKLKNFTISVSEISDPSILARGDYEDTFIIPFKTVKEDKKWPEYHPLRFSMESKYPDLLFRSRKSIKILSDLFGDIYSKGYITQWLSNIYIDMGDGDETNPYIDKIGDGCIFNGNFGTDHRENILDAIRDENGVEYYFSFGTINLPIDEVKRVKNIKVVHK